MIVILSAPIRSGKTTSLLQWAQHRNDVYGILTPDIDGKRVFMDLATKEQFPMEAAAEEEKLAVGKFTFSKKGFDKAIKIIQDAIDKKGWLIIDEIGPLELKGEGFSNVLKEVLKKRNDKIIIVVREELAVKVQDEFRFKATIIGNPGADDFNT